MRLSAAIQLCGGICVKNSVCHGCCILLKEVQLDAPVLHTRTGRCDARRAGGGDRAERRRQDDAALDPGRGLAGRGRGALAGGAVGWVPQQAALYRRLTVEENLLLFARLEGHEDPRRLGRGDARALRLAERRGEIVARLSGGNQQRINIAIGLLSRPAVLLLDEPSVGLDPRQRARLWEFVSGLAGGGTTVIFSTHDIQEAERYGGRLLVLADGEALFDGSPGELREAVRSEAPEAADRDFETAFVAFLHHRGH